MWNVEPRRWKSVFAARVNLPVFPHCIINLSCLIYQCPTFPIPHSDAGHFFVLRSFLSRCRAEYKKNPKIKKSNKRRPFGFIRERWCNYNTMKRRLIIVQRAQVDAKAQRIPQGWSVACCFWVKSGWVNVKMLPFKRKQWLRDWFTTFFSLSLSPPFFIQEEQSRLPSEKWQKTNSVQRMNKSPIRSPSQQTHL